MTPEPLIDQQLLVRTLETALAHGAEFAEVFVEQSCSHSLQLEQQQLHVGQALRMGGAGVRVMVGDEVGYGYTDVLDAEHLLRAAKTASSIAKTAGGQKSLVRLQTPALPSRYPVALLPQSEHLQHKANFLLRGDQAARAYSPHIAQVMGAWVDSQRDITIANSEGCWVSDRQIMCRLSFQAVGTLGQQVHTGFAGGGGRVMVQHFEHHSPEQMGQEAARMAMAQMDSVAARSGPQTVVLSPGWSGILLHEAIGHGLEADFIAQKTSLYAGKVGTMVASKQCTVIDSATIPHARGSLNVDDEGYVPQENVLIEQGVLRGYLNCRRSAAQLKVARTGSGRRESYQHTPMPRMSNTYLAAGNYSHEEIIASVSSGLYCAALGGGQVDISNGNFVFEVCEAYEIDQGRLGRPVKNAMLIGIGPETLAKVSMVGNNPQFDPGMGTCGKDGQSVPVGVGLPTVRIDDLVVGGTDVGHR